MSSVITMPPPKWRDLLKLNADGVPRKNLFNACIVTRHSPEIRGALAYDEFRQRIVKLRQLPWSEVAGNDDTWADIDTLCFVEWSEQNNLPMSDTLAAQAVQIVSAENRIHPVKDWLQSIHWDGTPRLDCWLTYYLGVDDSTYTRSVGAKWVISAVARVMSPGCQADHVLILEGKQGINKSTGLRILAGDAWFTDNLGDIRSKDAALQVQGVLIVEMAELDHLSKTDSTAMKAFLTTRIDRFRPPYGRGLAEFPRQCVFAGTVNESRYFKDITGNRRYWPVTVRSVDLDAIRADREQIWAEAYSRFRTGETWYLDDDEVIEAANRIQRERIESDPWEEKIGEFLQGKHRPFTIGKVLLAIDQDIGKWGKPHEMRVAKCLSSFGLSKMRETTGDRRVCWGTDEMFENDPEMKYN